MAQGRLQLNCENDLDECDRIFKALKSFANELNLSDRSLFEINLIIDEIFTNIVLYGFSDRKSHQILMEIQVMGDLAWIKIQDDGEPFNPLDAEPPDTESDVGSRAVGGLGIHIARRVSDDIDYRREKGKNILILKKNVTREKNSGRGGRVPHC